MNSKASTELQQHLNLYFQVHQPRRLSKYQFFDIGSQTPWFDDALNKSIIRRVAHECYLPANKMLLRLIRKYPHLRITFSISGVALDQLQHYAPDVLESFRMLAATGAVEFLGETYYHSLSFLMEKDEFVHQVKQHRQKVVDLLGVLPMVFRNTELIYSDAIGKTVYDLGFDGIYLDGIERVLKGRPASKLYRHPESDLILFPRNYSLSDDIAFRYSDRSWAQWPLTPGKFVGWLNNIPADQNFISLGMDYETFGEHQKSNGGIFQFIEQSISTLAKLKRFRFTNPSEAIKSISADHTLSTAKMISWADEAKDLSAWLGNDLQRDAFDSLNKLHDAILDTDDADLINDYRYLQTSDHFYYMSTKKDADGNVHQYFSHYSSPYEAFMNYMNVLADLEFKLKDLTRGRKAVNSFTGDTETLIVKRTTTDLAFA
jgi:alpha-amylase